VNQFLKRMQAGQVLVADGATGTNLQKVGLKPGSPPEDLVFEHPELILELERAFVEAGSDLILTCTFGATRLRMKGSQYAERVPEVNARAAELARKAASARSGVLVAGSIGPTGQLMKPFGPLTTAEAEEAFAEQAKALAEAGVDLLVIETQFAIEEASAAFQGLHRVTDLPIVVSFSYDRGLRTMMGVNPTEVVQKFQEMGAAMVGANCGTTLENMEKIVQGYVSAAPGYPLWAKPNAGLPHTVDGTAVYDLSPDQMASAALKYVELGARVVGGCCGSMPEHIAAIAKAVKARP